MTNEERDALLAGFTAILATLSSLELKTDALVNALGMTNPDLYSAYQKSLGTNPATTISTTLAFLNKTLRKTSQ